MWSLLCYCLMSVWSVSLKLNILTSLIWNFYFVSLSIHSISFIFQFSKRISSALHWASVLTKTNFKQDSGKCYKTFSNPKQHFLFIYKYSFIYYKDIIILDLIFYLSCPCIIYSSIISTVKLINLKPNIKLWLSIK